MPDWKQPDWNTIVRERMKSPSSQCNLDEDVIAELAAHLEETYENAQSRGLNATAALEATLQEVALQEINDWRVLAANIHRAQSEEHSMNQQRTRKLWLPALASITLTAVLLVVFDRIHASPLTVGLGHLAMMLQLAWFAAMPLLGQTKPEEALMNQRTRTIWLPGFVTLTAASLFLFAEEFALMHVPSFYSTDMTLRNQHLGFGVPFWLYSAWLLAQALCGALGAFLSRRGGGTRRARIVASAFPALMMFCLLGLVVPISAVFEHNAYVLSHPSGVAMGILIWAGGPGVALLLGAAPFLKESRHCSMA